MAETKRVRIIKGGRAAQAAGGAAEAKVASAPVREVRAVVSDWVRDHRRRSDEFRRNYSALLGEVGFKLPGCAA
ncbi:MAG TPA: hypothetical protein VJ866_11035 [Pyrinomonadaceae bacterium]|nr:hypothetical protein [Pyrinomonadaceae bacterium]